MHALAVEGGRALAKLWGTELLFEDTSRFGAMVPSVRYPWSTPAVPDGRTTVGETLGSIGEDTRGQRSAAHSAAHSTP